MIIFIDVDGVLVSYSDLNIKDKDGDNIFKPQAVESLNKIIGFYNADLCMISSWNTKFRNEQQYADFLRSRGLIFNKLYISDHNNRIQGIKDLLLELEEDKYLIIDDEAYKYYETAIKNKDFITISVFRSGGKEAI